MRTFNGPIPDRIARLPKDRRGYPIPYFVAYKDGLPLFPVMDPEKMRQAMRFAKCWVCGEQLGAYKCFAIGPMCVVNRISAEPPTHVDCATFAALNCPFMTQPLAKRVDLEKYGPMDAPGGVMIARNPGVTALWTTKLFNVIWDDSQPGHRKPLWRIGPPASVTFYARGRLGTRDEVNEAIRTGLPLLQDVAAGDGRAAVAELQRQIDATTVMLDTEVRWPDLPDVDLQAMYVEDAP